MAEYTCSVCNKEFYEEEKSLTNDESKCILHCDKKNTDNNLSNEFNIKLLELITNMEIENVEFFRMKSIIFPQLFDDTILQNTEGLSFNGCVFYGKVEITNKFNFSEKYVLFNVCTFYEDVFIRDTTVEEVFSRCNFKENSTLYCFNLDIKGELFNLTFTGGHLPDCMELEYCRFLDKNFELKNTTQLLNQIIIKNSKFNYHFEISDCSKINQLSIVNNTFCHDLYINKNNIDKLVLKHCDVSGHGIFVENDIKENELISITFQDIVSFQETIFRSSLDLKNVRFLSNVIFQETVFYKSINLRNTVFYNDVNFTDISKESTKIKLVEIKNRETARKIKDSFEKQNNIIEANKYYELEMKKREEELDNEENKNWLDWLIFKIHGVTSNHSQNALLALFWICVVGVFASYFSFYTMKDKMDVYMHFSILPFLGTMVLSISIIGCKYIFKKLEKNYYYFVFVFFPLLYYYTTNDSWFTLFANTINPFSIMTNGDSLNLGMLIFKVIIAYLMYQFVVSVRQNTRRK